MTIYTVGHSTHVPEDFATLLRIADVPTAIDIRSHRSSHWDWWTEPNIEPWMRQEGLDYRTDPRLGGWDTRHEGLQQWAADRGIDITPYLRGYFPKQRIARELEAGAGPAWTNQGLLDYAWFTATEEFQAGIADLVAGFGGEGADAAIFCSEVLWWKCHRSMVADVLEDRGVPVFHIMPPSKLGTPRISRHRLGDRLQRYPAEVRESWA